jgi:hypothetical protein
MAVAIMFFLFIMLFALVAAVEEYVLEPRRAKIRRESAMSTPARSVF